MKMVLHRVFSEESLKVRAKVIPPRRGDRWVRDSSQDDLRIWNVQTPD